MTETLPPITTEVLWRGTAILAVLAAIAIPVTVRLVPASRFRQLRLPVMAAAFLVWTGIWVGVLTVYWQPVYGYLFPPRLRWYLPLLFGVGFALLSLALFAVASRRPRHPALLFLLLGAALGPVTHVSALSRGILEKPPALRGASPVAALAVSFPEFALYWCVILLLAAFIDRAISRLRGDPGYGMRPSRSVRR